VFEPIDPANSTGSALNYKANVVAEGLLGEKRGFLLLDEAFLYY